MSTSTPTSAACLDLTGSSRAWDLTHVSVAERIVRHRRFGGEAKISDFLTWVKENRPTVIALDAPSGKHLAKTADTTLREQRRWKKNKYLNMRLCEAELVSRGVMLYYTRPDASAAQQLIKTGWELYQRLEAEFGYERVAAPGVVQLGDKLALVEVHPHAFFVAGLGWVPQNKKTLTTSSTASPVLSR